MQLRKNLKKKNKLTIIQTQVVPYRILPCWKFISVVRKAIDDELADPGKCQFLLRRLKNGHCD